MHPQLAELVDVCGKLKVTHVVLAGGIPKGVTSDKLYGCKVICFAPNVIIARRLINLGASALIIEGMEAGGHIGAVSTSVLAQEILPEIMKCRCLWPVALAVRSHRRLFEMGASGVQLGTRFVCATESIAHARFKALFVHSSARDAVPSIQVDMDFPIIPVRAIKNNATQDFGALSASGDCKVS